MQRCVDTTGVDERVVGSKAPLPFQRAFQVRTGGSTVEQQSYFCASAPSLRRGKTRLGTWSLAARSSVASAKMAGY